MLETCVFNKLTSANLITDLSILFKSFQRRRQEQKGKGRCYFNITLANHHVELFTEFTELTEAISV